MFFILFKCQIPGKDIMLIKGNRANIKVTTPEDLYQLRGMISYRETERYFGLDEE